MRLGWQRVVVDCGADPSVAAVVAKVREHSGGAARRLEPEVRVRLPPEGVTQLLTEIEGTLLPVVEVGAAEGEYLFFISHSSFPPCRIWDSDE